MLVWQSSRRVLAALVIGAAATLLRVVGVLAGPVWPILVAVPAYISIVALATILIERRRPVSRVALVALVALALLDVAAIFATAAFAMSPPYYARALLLSLLALQFTQLFAGRAPALTIVAGSCAAYGLLLGAAAARGASVVWAEEAWLLALYLLVALTSVALHTSANRRLAGLVELFTAAQLGDFSRPFTEDPRLEPDGVTLLGRAYNHLRSELALLVHTDTLTACLNRRGLDHVLLQTVRAAVRRGGELALLAVDVDHFKAVNDTAGHLVGDAVLREMAELLSRSSRAGDVVARVGGEEFVVLLPGADSETAGVVGERIAATVRAHAFRSVRGAHRVTVSIGIAAEQVTDAHVTASLRARADEALYVAKRLGRDRVVMWAPGIRSNATPPWTNRALTPV
jgi:diguanylate cyclase (GGDEF)-like protein